MAEIEKSGLRSVDPAHPGLAGGALHDRRDRHRPGRAGRTSPACMRQGNVPLPAFTEPIGSRRTRCWSASYSAAGPHWPRWTRRRCRGAVPAAPFPARRCPGPGPRRWPRPRRRRRRESGSHRRNCASRSGAGPASYEILRAWPNSRRAQTPWRRSWLVSRLPGPRAAASITVSTAPRRTRCSKGTSCCVPAAAYFWSNGRDRHRESPGTLAGRRPPPHGSRLGPQLRPPAARSARPIPTPWRAWCLPRWPRT